MTNMVEIHWTTASMDEARRVCRYLVQEKLVACAQIIPWIESVFLWNNEIDTVQESKIVLKTLGEHFETIRNIICENSQYEVPEITCLEVKKANPSYQEWVNEVVSSR